MFLAARLGLVTSTVGRVLTRNNTPALAATDPITGAPIRRRGERPTEPDDHAIGRSRGGTTTKIHLAVDGHGRPLSVVLSGGNVNDCTRFEQVLDQIEDLLASRERIPRDS